MIAAVSAHAGISVSTCTSRKALCAISAPLPPFWTICCAIQVGCEEGKEEGRVRGEDEERGEEEEGGKKRSSKRVEAAGGSKSTASSSTRNTTSHSSSSSGSNRKITSRPVT